MKHLSVSALVVFVFVCTFASPSFAQKYEFFPYAGGAFFKSFNVFDDQVEKFDFKNPGLFGVKGGGFLTPGFQLEGNVAWMNQFKLQSPQNPDTRALQYEILGNYNFGRSKVVPYVSAGAGGLTIHVSNSENDEQVTYFARTTPFDSGSPIPFTGRTLTIGNRDTFFTFSYGGGVRFPRFWGPMGFRFDLRGRTMPNFFGEAVNSWEPTGGITLTWGEP